MTIDVLGTKYSIFYKTAKQDKDLEQCDGYCDKTTKQIVVRKRAEDCNLGNFESYRKKVVRHELIHAFLFESGLHENFKKDEWGHDETTIDWFAVQFPKLLKAFQDADCLG